MLYKDVNECLMAIFPSFSVDYDDAKLPYITAGWFTKFLLDAYHSGDKETYQKGLEFIENLHLDEIHEVRELATVGYLESIQNTWPQELINSNIPFDDLGMESKKWWIELNNFWDGKIRYLGQSFEASP